MPCTTILVGRNASHDGSTIIARNDDGAFESKRVLAHGPREEAGSYKSVRSHLTVPLPGNALGYTDCPNVTKTNGLWPACGINRANVAMTATETITSHARVLGAGPGSWGAAAGTRYRPWSLPEVLGRHCPTSRPAG